jgi:hypothetical protein
MKPKMSQLGSFGLVLCLLLAVGLLPQVANAGSEPTLSRGQTVYVPVYSHVFIGTRGIPLNLSANVAVRNTDPAHSIIILSADYYDTEGKLVKKYLSEPKKLNAMGSTYFYVETADKTGGWGANFIVKWKSENEVNPPIMESIMSGSSGTHAYTYMSRGQPIKDTSK